MSAYVIRVTVAAPEPLIPAANQLALAFGESRDDDKSFGEPRVQDAAQYHYSIVSTVAVEQFPVIVTGDIEAAAIERFGPDHPVDLVLARQAQDALVVWAPSIDPETGELILGPQASPDVIVAVIHDDPHQALQWLGLTAIQADVPEEPAT